MERTRIKQWRLLLTGAVMIALTAPAVQAQGIREGGCVVNNINVQPYPDDEFRIWVWPDRGEGGSYLPGDNIRINVEVTRSCYLILYNLDTRGNLRILYPFDPWDNNYVAAGDVITFPQPWDQYEWTVDGPPGQEYVQAIASEFPIRPPDWPIYMRTVNHGGAVCVDPELRDFRAGNDRFDYIDVVNRKITGRFWNWCATDLATFYIQPHYYRPTWHDPWPDVFYGEIYIGWPIGGRIYIDGIYVGIAPLWIPSRYGHGPHVVVCREGRRVVRTQTVHYYPKQKYEYSHVPVNRKVIVERGRVKAGRLGGVDHFKVEAERERQQRQDHRTPVVIERERKPVPVDRRVPVTRDPSRVTERDRVSSKVTTRETTTRTVEVDRSVSIRAREAASNAKRGSTISSDSRSKVSSAPKPAIKETKRSTQVTTSSNVSNQGPAKVKREAAKKEEKTTVDRPKTREADQAKGKSVLGKRRK